MVLIISFAATSLDTAGRIQRYVVEEFAESWSIPLLKNRYISGLCAMGSAFVLVTIGRGGTGGLLLWPLFGASNQMLAVLTLSVIAVFLMVKGKSATAYIIPLVFLAIVTTLGLFFNIVSFYQSGRLILSLITGILLLIQLWIVTSASRIMIKCVVEKKSIFNDR